MNRRITTEDLRGLRGLRRTAARAILASQPRTVLSALRIRDVGRKTAKALLEVGLITDPDDAMHRCVFDLEADGAGESTR